MSTVADEDSILMEPRQLAEGVCAFHYQGHIRELLRFIVLCMCYIAWELGDLISVWRNQI